MNEKVKLDSYYETSCGLVAKVRTTTHEGINPVIATVLHPPHSADPDYLPGKKSTYGDKGLKENKPFTIYGKQSAEDNDLPYDFVREVEKPADWDEIPDPEFT